MEVCLGEGSGACLVCGGPSAVGVSGAHGPDKSTAAEAHAREMPD